MQRIIRNTLVILLFLTVPAYAGGAMGLMVAAGSSAAGLVACSPGTTDHDGFVDLSDDVAGNNYDVGTIAQQINITSNSRVTFYRLPICRHSATTGNQTVALYTDNGSNQMGSLVTDSSITIPYTDLNETGWPNCSTTTDFTLPVALAVASAKYWIKVTLTDNGAVNWYNTGAVGQGWIYQNSTYYENSGLTRFGIFGCTP